MEIKEEEYFTKKEILEKLKWLIFSFFCLDILITVDLILFFVNYNPIPLLSTLSGLTIGIVGYNIYKKYKK
ncbi:MAG: hypothetical protein ACFFCE_15465 [Promethearchaeota archaeon]